VDNFKRLYQSLKDSGFDDLHVLHFPQPTQPLGSCTAILANRQGAFKRIREKDIFNKAFTTRYYNFDMHRAAMALPPFTRDALALET
jgi:spermidine synthase